MPKPQADWYQKLPSNRLVAEFSMWSADLVRLADEAEKIAQHADLLHIDVADGHFAPALLFFPDLVARIRQVSVTPIHIHLMIKDHVLLSQIDQFAGAGADLISIHCENTNAVTALDHMKSLGIRTGMVLKVETPVEFIKPFLSKLDFVTLLGTAIGVKGQGLDPTATTRLREAKALIAETGRRIVLAADGGIRENTVPELRRAGAETVVLGSLAFGAPDLSERMTWLKSL